MADKTFGEVGRKQENAGSKIGELLIKLNVDVSDALKGLKAIQREVRETIKVLKELETYQGVDEHGVARKLSEEIKKLEWRVRGVE